MRVLCGVVALLVSILVGRAHAQVDKAFTAPAFTAKPAELIAAARRVTPADVPIVVLRREMHVNIDAQGRTTTRNRLVYQIRAQAGVDAWSGIAARWYPHYQDKPAVRARVIDPSGTVTELDPALVQDEASGSSDLRVLQAPLPHRQIGSIIEEQVTITARVSPLASGTLQHVSFDHDAPVASTTVTIVAPIASKAKVVARNITARPRRTAAGSLETWTYELGAMPAYDEIEGSLPSDVVTEPYIGVSTVPAWSAVARDYRRIVEERIAAGPATLPAGVPRTATLETLHAIVAWLHANVRDTGVELGESAITPATPAETTKRGAGDSKDRTTLLVALLRQAGIAADLALLQSGPGVDVDTALPGLAFDHVIVRATVGGRVVWIDASEELDLAGGLPMRDEGRRALVIADSTRDLTLTPRSTSADSVIRQVRTFELAETGPAKVTEVSREGGLFEAEQRRWIRDETAARTKEGLVSYAEQEYRGTYLSHTTTAPADLTRPFEVSLVVGAAHRAYTELSKIDVLLYPSDVLEKLPPDLLEQTPPARKHDFEFWRPHRMEIENRLVFPPGYRAPTPVAERTRKLGTATLVERQRLDGNVFIFTYSFDSGKARLTPAELAALHRALVTVAAEERRVTFEHIGLGLADAGNLAAAAVEIQRLINKHPQEAVHQTELAVVYLQAGMGAAARRHARKAVALEPKNATAHAMLGYVLMHDTIGRERGHDHDRKGAVAALRTARKLEPTHQGALGTLGQILELGPTGWQADADLAGALEARAAAYELDKTDERAVSLARLQIRNGKPAAAETTLRAHPSSEARDALLLVAVALDRGVDAGLAEVSQVRTPRATVLGQASQAAIAMRAYDVSRAFLQASGNVPAGSQAETIFKRWKQRPSRLDRADPTTIARLWFQSSIDRRLEPDLYWDDATRQRIAGSRVGTDPVTQAMAEIGLDAWADFSHSIPVKVDGPAGGPWRAEMQMLDTPVALYVALDRGVGKIIGAQGVYLELARLAQRNARNAAGARQILDWIQADMTRTGGSVATAFLKFWNTGLSRDAAATELAIAYVAASKASLPVLARCAAPFSEARALCDTMIASVYETARDWVALERHMTAAMANADAKPDPKASAAAAYWLVRALTFSRQFDRAEAALRDAVAKAPNPPYEAYLREEIAFGRGARGPAFAAREARVAAGNPNPNDKNSLAWMLLAEDRDLPRALQLAREAVEAEPTNDAAINTLAAVAAATGELGTGATMGLKAIRVRQSVAPTPADWLVFAIIAERLGLREDAIALYRKVGAEPGPFSFTPTSRDIAISRLARLGVK